MQMMRTAVVGEGLRTEVKNKIMPVVSSSIRGHITEDLQSVDDMGPRTSPHAGRSLAQASKFAAQLRQALSQVLWHIACQQFLPSLCGTLVATAGLSGVLRQTLEVVIGSVPIPVPCNAEAFNAVHELGVGACQRSQDGLRTLRRVEFGDALKCANGQCVNVQTSRVLSGVRNVRGDRIDTEEKPQPRSRTPIPCVACGVL
mmetsp:Transcript_53352/g.142777  ORF Transcript_53352/g.142777 Transcript_53352/m.142777 type:complete len:201 (+) Transcript_53352:1167-1769(+)